MPNDMGINPVHLSDRQLALVSPADRLKLPRRLRLTQQERQRAQITRLERHIHDQFVSFLKRHELPYTHSSPVRRSSIQIGTPDFQITRGGRSIYVEFKVPPNNLSTEQSNYFAFLERNGNRVIIATESSPGAAYAKATREVSQFFNLTNG